MKVCFNIIRNYHLWESCFAWNCHIINRRKKWNYQIIFLRHFWQTLVKIRKLVFLFICLGQELYIDSIRLVYLSIQKVQPISSKCYFSFLVVLFKLWIRQLVAIHVHPQYFSVKVELQGLQLGKLDNFKTDN